MTESKKIRVYETTASSAHTNLFIRSLALYTSNLSEYQENVASHRIYDTTHLIEAEKNLNAAFAIAVNQVLAHENEEFKHWLRSERWVAGSWAVLARKWDDFRDCTEGDRLRERAEDLANLVASIDEVCHANEQAIQSGADPTVKASFNEMVQAARTYDNLIKRNEERGVMNVNIRRREDTLFLNLFSRVRSFVQVLCDPNCPEDLLSLYTKGDHGSTFANIIAIVIEQRQRAFETPEIYGDTDDREQEYQQFKSLWDSGYREKLGLCGVYAKELNKLIQTSIQLYLYYDKCSFLERAVEELRLTVTKVVKAAAKNVSAIARKAVTWEFLKAGFMTAFWPLLAPVFLTIDHVNGYNAEQSWYHGMNQGITAAWNKSPATLILVTASIVTSAVFVGMASAAAVGVSVPGLALTHTSGAIASLAVMGGAATIGGYAWKRKQQLAIEAGLMDELKAIEGQKANLEAQLELVKAEVESKKSIANEVFEDIDDLAAFKAEERQREDEYMREKRAARKAAKGASAGGSSNGSSGSPASSASTSMKMNGSASTKAAAAAAISTSTEPPVAMFMGTEDDTSMMDEIQAQAENVLDALGGDDANAAVDQLTTASDSLQQELAAIRIYLGELEEMVDEDYLILLKNESKS